LLKRAAGAQGFAGPKTTKQCTARNEYSETKRRIHFPASGATEPVKFYIDTLLMPGKQDRMQDYSYSGLIERLEMFKI
jgi:hypothetical protein